MELQAVYRQFLAIGDHGALSGYLGIKHCAVKLVRTFDNHTHGERSVSIYQILNCIVTTLLWSTTFA